jgi:hypothetical protein
VSLQNERLNRLLNGAAPPAIFNRFLAVEPKFHAEVGFVPLRRDVPNQAGQIADSTGAHHFKFDPEDHAGHKFFPWSLQEDRAPGNAQVRYQPADLRQGSRGVDRPSVIYMTEQNRFIRPHSAMGAERHLVQR